MKKRFIKISLKDVKVTKIYIDTPYSYYMLYDNDPAYLCSLIQLLVNLDSVMQSWRPVIRYHDSLSCITYCTNTTVDQIVIRNVIYWLVN